ncbi:MAG: glutamate--tRNA ligase family protein [Oligoflexales bacterium]
MTIAKVKEAIQNLKAKGGKHATRFAPSPTGYLHLGHVASAIMVWGVSRQISATVRLRIEDVDLSRAKPEYYEAILKDLEWLGFEPDFPSTIQSRYQERYEIALSKLRSSNLTYFCGCSRKEISATSEDPSRMIYKGTCRAKGLTEGPNRGVRLGTADDPVDFFDFYTKQTYSNPASHLGDILIKDRLAQWTFLFASAVDDVTEGISLIIRGQDLLDTCQRQLYIKRCLGHEQPVLFLHHPLLVDDTGKKLSKRFLSTSVTQFREQGAGSEKILGEAAFALGLTTKNIPMSLQEIYGLFE